MQSNLKKRLILASSSPRRKELLTRMGIPFEIKVSDADENAEGLPCDIVRELAVRKAVAVAETTENAWIVAADTLVSLNDKPLGKPADEEDAFNMLKSLSGTTHQVYTGICLMDADTKKYIARSAGSDVIFKTVTDRDIRDYLNEKEYVDKAGAYAIQGIGARLVEGYRGSYDNIVGFPTEIFREMLDTFMND